jgi:hypothetical protein
VTWLDRQPQAQVDAAIAELAGDPDLVARYYERAGGDQRYSLWLAMVDLHIEALPDTHSTLDWDWKRAYRSGWSPRTAAFAAWASATPDGTEPALDLECSHAGTVVR